MVIGSFMLLSLLTLSVNRAIINNMEETYQSESIIAATTLAQSLMQEVSLKAFDEKTISGPVDSTGGLTSVVALGRDGEIYPFFDDIDDYKNYTRSDTIANGWFRSAVDIQYVDPTTLNSSGVATFYKKISVTVIDPLKMNRPITLTNVISY